MVTNSLSLSITLEFQVRYVGKIENTLVFLALFVHLKKIK